MRPRALSCRAATWSSSGSARARCGRTARRTCARAASPPTPRAGSPPAARWAVGADNVAWDIPDEHDPELGSLPGHTILIVQSGIHIIESLFLEELAADGVREFGWVCLLASELCGGPCSPVRPIALCF